MKMETSSNRSHDEHSHMRYSFQISRLRLEAPEITTGCKPHR